MIDSVQDDKTASWFYTHDGSQRAVVLAIQRQPGTNTIDVTDGVKAAAAVVQAEIAAVGSHGHSVRPVRHHPRVVPRREVHHGCSRWGWSSW